VRSPRLFGALFLLLILVLCAIVPLVAVRGAEHLRAELLGQERPVARALVSLVLLWLVVGFLVYYLLQLARENARIRKLYRHE
jgi:hypothetical protein